MISASRSYVTALDWISPGAICHTCAENLATLATAAMQATRGRPSFRYPAGLLMETGDFGVDINTPFCLECLSTSPVAFFDCRCYDARLPPLQHCRHAATQSTPPQVWTSR
jgi:hypothetical protein